MIDSTNDRICIRTWILTDVRIAIFDVRSEFVRKNDSIALHLRFALISSVARLKFKRKSWAPFEMTCNVRTLMLSPWTIIGMEDRDAVNGRCRPSRHRAFFSAASYVTRGLPARFPSSFLPRSRARYTVIFYVIPSRPAVGQLCRCATRCDASGFFHCESNRFRIYAF